MKARKILISSTIASIALLTVHSLPVFAAPTGTITISVQNQTTNSQLVEANDAASALTAKNGDVLKYVLEMSNTADAAIDGSNDLDDVSFSSTLPSGVKLVSNSVQRTLSGDLGTLEGGKKVTKEYLVTVTSDKDTESLLNKACLKAKGQAEKCDNAYVTVSNPKPAAPTPTPTPPAPAPTQPTPPAQPTPTPQAPAAITPAPAAAASNLPQTGPSAFFAPLAAIGAGAVAYGGRLLMLKRRG